jgi:hypothetical protein
MYGTCVIVPGVSLFFSYALGDSLHDGYNSVELIRIQSYSIALDCQTA